MQAIKGIYRCNVSSVNNKSCYGVNRCTAGHTYSLKTAYLASNLFINFAGIAMNGIVVFVYQKNKQLRTKSNVIIATIAIASLFLAISEIIMSLAHLFSSEKHPTKQWVIVQKCIEAVIGYYSIQAMALMSILRRAIVSQIRRPNNHTNLLQIKLVLVAMGSFTAVASIILINMLNTAWLNITLYFSCNIVDVGSSYYYYYIVFLVAFSFVPICITIGSYSYIHNRIRRKSGALHRKIRRESLKRGRIKRADMQSSLGITIILIFVIMLYLPRETLALLLAVRRKLISQQWLYFTSILISNVFQQLLSLAHACTSTRYRLKLRQSLTRAEMSMQTTESGNYPTIYTCNSIQRMQLRKLDNQLPGGFQNNSIDIGNSRKSNSINILHSVYNVCTNQNNTKDSLSARDLVAKEVAIFGLNQASGRALEKTKSEQLRDPCNKSTLGILRRRYTDSELVMKNKACYFLENVNTLMNHHTKSDTIPSKPEAC